ncbi:hypothetical protein CWD61_10160 [Escherichia coli]|nr:hypothetical protein [Salmonella enterica]EAX6961605.1 hypothetical protein [Salmonella enterica]EDW0437130.1 hypothetical protein [Salmonella enterica subsp. enterica serovar Lexington]MIM61913.1 hypothetical protein [Salmonella enterica]PJW70820.1 hypothetical protein CWD61_10160 [Escherichia coli]
MKRGGAYYRFRLVGHFDVSSGTPTIAGREVCKMQSRNSSQVIVRACTTVSGFFIWVSRIKVITEGC